jgi:hypothetical protein
LPPGTGGPGSAMPSSRKRDSGPMDMEMACSLAKKYRDTLAQAYRRKDVSVEDFACSRGNVR